jgi:nucleotide-binding universal stress UspA family protein
MAMYKKALVPLDGSPLAEAILPHVEELARPFGTTVLLLQVVELVHMVDPNKATIDHFDAMPQQTAESVERQAQAAQLYLDGLVQALAEKGIQAHSHVAYGQIVASIMEYARHEEADLIAMASHGRTGKIDVYYGSVAAGILQRIDRPLLIVRAQALSST